MAWLFMQKQWMHLVGLFLVMSLEMLVEGNYLIEFLIITRKHLYIFNEKM